jgi:hypothetical protein
MELRKIVKEINDIIINEYKEYKIREPERIKAKSDLLNEKTRHFKEKADMFEQKARLEQQRLSYLSLLRRRLW